MAAGSASGERAGAGAVVGSTNSTGLTATGSSSALLYGLSPDELAHSRRWFQRHGAAVVFWGRLIPAIRTLISVPAGVELMPWGPFLFWTTAGSLIWNVALTAAGWTLGSNWNRVLAFIKPIEGIVNKLLVLLIVAVVAWLALRLWRRRGGAH